MPGPDPLLPPPRVRPPTLRPRIPRDLLLAPVAAAIDLELQHLRGLTVAELGLELDSLEQCTTRDERASCVLQAALKGVDTHHWWAEITDDGARLRLTGGSVSLDLGLSPTLMHYIQGSDGH
jgi:hypothetical protein